jgi:transcriptional regulator with XRE-family HTH domain
MARPYQPPLTKQQWAEARQTFETEPTATLESISQTLGVSRPAVSKKAKKEEWQKAGTLRMVCKAAQLKADQVTDVTGVTSKKDATDNAIALRASVIEKHREEWALHRNRFSLDDIHADFDMGKKAKISSEMLMIRQSGERKAWGLDDDNQQQQPVQPQTLLVVGQRTEITR